MYEGDTVKDPADVLDYETDLANTTNGGSIADFLRVGETINTFFVTVPTGINLHDGATTFDGVIRAAPAKIKTDTSVLFWLSGGSHTKNYVVTVSITTTDLRIIERSRIIQVRQS